ncbi:uncharacterized protein LOC106094316 [Stomoxys calcitrans]|uniref:uncharacterized protein LOC106094316 n=1 Tax=Stomoxys calcitrans TaxID=35570 RepID=UPI0027E379D4|nr:uncharacterized protein LOC106094316 [Stomoxys calcitrans]
MSSKNDEPVLLTFEELKHLEVEDIAICIDKYQAMQICEKSTAYGDIYNVWVRKLLKSYGGSTAGISTKDWIQILEYLAKVLEKFVYDLSNSKTDMLVKQLNQWWNDTLEFLKWLHTIISGLDVHIVCLILAFALEIVIKTCKIADRRLIQPVIQIHQQLLYTLTNNMLKMDMQNIEDLKGFSKVLISLCDVATIISSSDIKLSIETWRIVAKISGKFSGYFNNIQQSGGDEIMNELKINATGKPITGIIKELNKLFNYFLEDDEAPKNENFLKVAQFYLKLIKSIMKNTQLVPAPNEFLQVYTKFLHQLKIKISRKYIEPMQKDLNDILAMANNQEGMENYVLQHLVEDNEQFVSCDLILQYMSQLLEDNNKHIISFEVIKRIFNVLFDGPLIFIEGEKYAKLLSYFAALTAEDISGDLHILWCTNLLEAMWIKALTSCEILRMYYGYLLNASNEQAHACLEFWIKSWQNCNVEITTSSFGYKRFLIERLIRTIALQLPSNNHQLFFHNHPNCEVLLLKCGLADTKSRSYLNTTLTDHLNGMLDMQLNKKQYIELLDLLDICCSHGEFVNFNDISNKLVKAFLLIFSLPMSEIQKFRHFIYKCFAIFKILNNMQLDKEILKCLEDNLNKIKEVFGVFMLEYLMQRKPQSQTILKRLTTPEVMKLQRFLETSNNKTGDLRIFQDAYNRHKNKCKQPSLQDVHISKRPRVAGEGLSSDYKCILNEMFEQSKLILTKQTATTFDDKDYDLLICIKTNIEKCLKK